MSLNLSRWPTISTHGLCLLLGLGTASLQARPPTLPKLPSNTVLVSVGKSSRLGRAIRAQTKEGMVQLSREMQHSPCSLGTWRIRHWRGQLLLWPTTKWARPYVASTPNKFVPKPPTVTMLPCHQQAEVSYGP